MKKVFSWMVLLITIGLIMGCSVETEEVPSKVSKNVEEQPSDDDSKEQTEKEDKENEKDTEEELNKEIVNDDKFRAVLLSVKKEKDSIFGDQIVVKFELENKTDQTIEVQAREVSADGKMVDDGALTMSQEISPGKIADGKLKMMSFDDYELPELKENLELILHVFSWDDMDFALDYPVEVTFN